MGDHWSENHREYVARQAAQVIVEGASVPSSTISSPAGTLSSSITMPGPEYSINAPLMDPMQSCLAEGGEPQGRMSAVRRFFCLLVTFDLLFTILVWLVCSLVGGQSLEKALFNQVVKYSIRTSLFDIVMTSAYRFVILILMFGLLRVMHWWPVAITTAGSSAFLIAKVFLCEWDKISNYTFSVILLLCSFILAWGETWFLDFRVLPQEQHARDLLDPERTHLLHNHRQQLPRYGDSVLGDNAPFYSPLESPAGSEDEETNSDLYPGRQRQLTQQDHEYKLKGKEVLEQAWQLLNSDGWSLEKQNSDGDTVHSKSVPKVGKIFKLSGLVDIPPRKLLDEVYYKIEEVPNWNPTLTKCKTLHTIDNHTDISYQVAAEAGGGLVSSRDFVNLRHWEMRGDVYIAAGVSTTHPKMPPQKNFVRGENGPGAWVMRPVEGDPNKCLFQWLLNTNLKGWIPQYIIDQTLSVVMLDYIRHIRNYSDEMRRQEVL